MNNRLSDHQLKQKNSFIKVNRYWNDVWDELLCMDENFFEVYSNFISVPWKTGVLEPKIKEFINIAVSSSPTPNAVLEITNPVNGDTAGEVYQVGVKETEYAISAAKEAFRKWAGLSGMNDLLI
jgi:hypothetical protein